MFEIGVLQPTLFARACRAIAANELDNLLSVRQQPVVQDVMPSTHEAVGLDLGLGYAQGGGAAFDVAGSGTLAGYRVSVA